MVNTYPDLFWGYSVICVLFAGYQFYLGRKIRKLEEMHRSLQKNDAKGA